MVCGGLALSFIALPPPLLSMFRIPKGQLIFLVADLETGTLSAIGITIV